MPVLVNGSIESAEDAWGLKQNLSTYGVMIGRQQLETPIFRQIREVSKELHPCSEKSWFTFIAKNSTKTKEARHLRAENTSRMKISNYIGAAIMDNGVFLNQMRRVFEGTSYMVFSENTFLEKSPIWNYP